MHTFVSKVEAVSAAKAVIFALAFGALVFVSTGCGGAAGGSKSAGSAISSSGSGAGGADMHSNPDGALFEDDSALQIYDILVREFNKKLNEVHSGKFASEAPKYTPGQVFDLYYDIDTKELKWTYYNPGDYDLDGKIGVSDITPIALNYGARIVDGEWEDPYHAWLDGSEDGQIGISDVYLIAINYLKKVDGYEVFTATAADGEYELLGSVEFSSAAPSFPREYSFKLPKQGKQYVTVRPYFAGATGNDSPPVFLEAFYFPPAPPEWIIASQGEFNNRIRIEWAQSEGAVGYFVFDGDTGDNVSMVYGNTSYNDYSPISNDERSYFVMAFNELGRGPASEIAAGWANGIPAINSVMFGEIYISADAVFSASVTGLGTFEYSWGFGDFAEPAQSSEIEPIVKFNTTGYVDCSLTVTNEYGSANFPFQVSVWPADEPPAQPEIISVSQIDAVERDFVRFSAEVTGTEPYTYSWDFGSGAEPSTTSHQSPNVKLKNPGLHNGTLIVSNAIGSAQFDFEYNVQLYWVKPSFQVYLAPKNEVAYSNKNMYVHSVSGRLPIDFEWDFGGGATPNIVTGEAANVQFTGEGWHTLTVTATNEVDSVSKSYDFYVAGTRFDTQQISTTQYDSVTAYYDSEGFFGAVVGRSGSPNAYIGTLISDGSEWNYTGGGLFYNADLRYFARQIVFDSFNNPLYVTGYPNLDLYISNGAGFSRDDDLVPYYSYSASMALNANDEPVISYVRSDLQGNYATYLATRIAGVWSHELIDEESRLNSVLKYDTDAVLHLVYSTSGSTTEGEIIYATYDGVDWNFEAISSQIGTMIFDLEFIDETTPVIAYVEYTASSGKPLQLAAKDNGEWIYSLVDDNVTTNYSSAMTQYPIILGDNQSNVHLLYRNTSGLNYALANAQEIVNVHNIASTSSAAFYNMNLDQNSLPHILYYQWVGSQIVQFYTFNDLAEWRTHPVAYASGVASMALDSSDIASIIFVGDNGTYYARFTQP